MTPIEFTDVIKPCLDSLWPFVWRDPGDDLITVWTKALRRFDVGTIRSVLHEFKASQTTSASPTVPQIIRACSASSPERPGASADRSWVKVQRHAFIRAKDIRYKSEMSDDEVRDLVSEIIRANGYPVRSIGGAPVPCRPATHEDESRMRKEIADAYESLSLPDRRAMVRKMLRAGITVKPMTVKDIHTGLCASSSSDEITDDIPF